MVALGRVAPAKPRLFRSVEAGQPPVYRGLLSIRECWLKLDGRYVPFTACGIGSRVLALQIRNHSRELRAGDLAPIEITSEQRNGFWNPLALRVSPERFTRYDLVEMEFFRLCVRYGVPIPKIGPALPTDPCDYTDQHEVRLNVEAVQDVDPLYHVLHVWAHYLCGLHATGDELPGDGRGDMVADMVADMIARLLAEAVRV